MLSHLGKHMFFSLMFIEVVLSPKKLLVSHVASILKLFYFLWLVLNGVVIVSLLDHLRLRPDVTRVLTLLYFVHERSLQVSSLGNILVETSLFLRAAEAKSVRVRRLGGTKLPRLLLHVTSRRLRLQLRCVHDSSCSPRRKALLLRWLQALVQTDVLLAITATLLVTKQTSASIEHWPSYRLACQTQLRTIVCSVHRTLI